MAPALASASSFGSRTLSLGVRGTDVNALQHDLTAVGFNTVATGTFAIQTEREVKAFQLKYHLQADGVAGPATFSKLRSLLSAVNHISEAAPTSHAQGSGGSGLGVQSTVVQVSYALDSTSTVATTAANSGGTGFAPTSQSSGPVAAATLVDGLAVPAPGTPQAVVNVIEAANAIAFLPYIYGGGHKDYVVRNGKVQIEPGYDCSGSVSFALFGGSLLREPEDSEQFASYGSSGNGEWLTVYTNGTHPTGTPHAYLEVAGLYFDTAAQSADNGNDRWSTVRIAEPGSRYIARHPAGL